MHRHNHMFWPLKSVSAAGLRIWMLVLALLLAACGGRATPVVSVPASGRSAATASTTQGVVTIPTMAAPTAAATTAATPPTQTLAPTVAGMTPTAGSAALPVSGGNARDAVINAMHAVQKAGPYRVKSTSTSDTKTIESTAEVILPDRFHIITNGREMLIVGNKSYIKQNGKWAAFPIDIGSMVSGMIGALTSQVENSITSVQQVGTDSVQGAPATVYQFSETVDLGGSPVTSQVKMWVDNARGLPVRQEIQGEAGGVKSTTVQEITYDPSITIEAPAQ